MATLEELRALRAQRATTPGTTEQPAAKAGAVTLDDLKSLRQSKNQAKEIIEFEAEKTGADTTTPQAGAAQGLSEPERAALANNPFMSADFVESGAEKAAGATLGFAQGVGQGLLRAGAGAIQLGADTIQGTMDFLTGEKFARALEKEKAGDDSEIKQWSGAVADWVSEFEGKSLNATANIFKETPGFTDAATSPALLRTGKFAGEALPSFFLRGKTWLDAAVAGALPAAAAFKEDPSTASPRAVDAAVGLGFGLATKGVLDGVDWFKRPDKFAAQGGAIGSDKKAQIFYDANKKFLKSRGIDPDVTTLAQLSGEPTTRSKELQALMASDEAVRRHRSLLNTQDKQVRRMFLRDMNKLDPDKADYGTKAFKTFKKAADSMVTSRRNQAAKDFGAVRKVYGDEPTIDLTNTLEQLDEFSQRYGGKAITILSEQARKVGKSAEAKKLMLLDELEGRISPAELQDLLHITGSSADGSSKLFTDSTGLDKTVAKALHRALQNDLDSAIVKEVPGSDLLKVARDNYAAASQNIDDFRSMTLTELFDAPHIPSPKALENKLRDMGPGQIKAAMEVLGETDPGFRKATQKFMLQRAFEDAATEGGVKALAKDTRFDFDTLVKKVNSSPELKAIFSDKEGRKMFNDITRTLTLLKNRVPKATSAQNIAQQEMQMVGSAVSLSPIFLARSAVASLHPNRLGDILFTPGAASNVRLVMEPTTAPAVASKAASQLMNLIQEKDEFDQRNQEKSIQGN